MELWIHVDLKCMAPTPHALMRDLARWAADGATGVVLEWENMFPYPGIEAAVRRDAYTRRQVTQILDHCRRHGLKAIPLVQTFGHVEWCLSHPKYAHLREFPDEPKQIRACDERSWALLKSWIAALLEAHHDSPYIHLGADEAWRLGEVDRPDCSAKREGPARVFLRHMRPLFDQVIAAGKRPIIWADMVLRHPEALPEFPREVVFNDWLYSQTSEHAPAVHVWGVGQVTSEKYETLSAECRARFEKYWRIGAPEFPKQFYQFPYLPFIRDQGFDVVAGSATLYAGNALASPHLPHARANGRGWLEAAHRFGGLGVLNTCWAVRCALRETTRAGHRSFLIQGRALPNLPDDSLVSEGCWRPLSKSKASEIAAVVDQLHPPVDPFSRSAPLRFDTEARTHRPVPYDERLAEWHEKLAQLRDDDPQVLDHQDAPRRAAQVESILRPLLSSRDETVREEARAWILGAREVSIRSAIWLAVREKGRGRPISTSLDELVRRIRAQARGFADFLKGRYQLTEKRIAPEDRYGGLLRLIAKLTE